MVTISNKEMALLDLLSEGPLHAYGIEKEIENRSMREWTEISMSSVYKLLNKLSQAGLITAEVRLAQNNISQKVYAITQEGLATLKERIKTFLSEPEKYLHRLDLATSHLGLLGKEEALTCLRAYRQRLLEAIACYRELEEYLKGEACPIFDLALARRPQYILKGEICWVDEYLQDIALMDKKDRGT
jgi:DNA-binding PadR family transcriptional regulator